jgi:mannose-1-phosphate guanylyltransferase
LNKITLIGVAPDYPATGFGYIKTGKEVANEDGLPIMSVEKFVEKPDEKTARSYFKSKKYLWNLGLFAGSINTFEAEIKKSNKSLWKRYNQLFEKDALESYMNFPNEPIDTALIEKVKDLIVVPGHFDWADIGSFKDLYEILRNGDSNVHKGDVYDIDSKESLVIADKKPIITIGLDNLIVVDTPEGILVCPKDKCQLVKDGVEKLNSKK